MNDNRFENKRYDEVECVSFWIDDGIKNAIEAKKDFMKDFEINLKYYVQEEAALKKVFRDTGWIGGDDKGGAVVTIPRMYDYHKTYKPHMFFELPKLALSPQTTSRKSAALVEKYMQWDWQESGFKEDIGLSVTDGILSGGFAFYSYLNRERRMPWTEHVPIGDLLWDPAATRPKDASWCAIEYNIALWDALKRWPHAKDSLISEAKKSVPESFGKEKQETNYETVKVYKVFSKIGLHPFAQFIDTNGYRFDDETWQRLAASGALQKDVMGQTSDKVRDFIEIMLVDGGKKFLEVRAWQTPLDADEWPISFGQLEIYPKRIWPFSALRPLRPLQEYENQMNSFMLNVMRFLCSIKIVLDKAKFNDPVLKAQLEGGKGVEYLMIEGNLNQAFTQLLQMGQIHPQMFDLLKQCTYFFERISRLDDFTRGQPSRQMRSAEEAKFIEGRSQAPIQAPVDVVKDVLLDCARKGGVILHTALMEGGLDPQKGLNMKDVAPVIGAAGRDAAMNQAVLADWPVFNSIEEVRREYLFSFGITGAQRIDPEKRRGDLAAFMQRWLPVLQATQNFPALRELFERDAQYNEITLSDLATALMPPPPPPLPPGAPAGVPGLGTAEVPGAPVPPAMPPGMGQGMAAGGPPGMMVPPGIMPGQTPGMPGEPVQVIDGVLVDAAGNPIMGGGA